MSSFNSSCGRIKLGELIAPQRYQQRENKLQLIHNFIASQVGEIKLTITGNNNSVTRLAWAAAAGKVSGNKCAIERTDAICPVNCELIDFHARSESGC